MSWAILLVFMSAYLAFSLALTTTLGSNVVLGYTRFSHDNQAHLYIPRTIVDNGACSKLANLGTVWLPLYHLALMPLVIINALYTTGLAGSIINAVITAATASTIYLIIKGRLGVVAAVTYGASMYAVIHASSSYMVPIGQFLAIASTYYALRYVETSSLKSLTKASAFTMLATLARYEAWLTAGFLILVIIIKELRRRPWVLIAYGSPAMLGIVGWLIYNWVIFGNPLEFITHPSLGASGYYYVLIRKLTNPVEINVAEIAYVITWLVGPPALILVPVGAASLLRGCREGSGPSGLVNGVSRLLLLGGPLLLLIIAGPELLILDVPLYFYFLVPNLVILMFNGVRALSVLVSNLMPSKVRMKDIRLLAAAILTLLVVGSIAMQQIKEYRVLNSQLAIGDRYYWKEVSRWSYVISLWRRESKGYILMITLLNSYNLSVLTGLSPKYIIDEYDMPYFKSISRYPWRYNVSVVIMPDLTKYEALRPYMLGLVGHDCYVVLYYSDPVWRAEFLRHYVLVREFPEAHLIIFVKRH